MSRSGGLNNGRSLSHSSGEAGSARSRCQRGCACPGGRGKKSVPRLPLAFEAALGVLLCVAVSGPLFFLYGSHIGLRFYLPQDDIILT